MAGSPPGGWRGCDWAVLWSGPGGEALRTLRVVTDSDGYAEVVWKRGLNQGRTGGPGLGQCGPFPVPKGKGRRSRPLAVASLDTSCRALGPRGTGRRSVTSPLPPRLQGIVALQSLTHTPPGASPSLWQVPPSTPRISPWQGLPGASEPVRLHPWPPAHLLRGLLTLLQEPPGVGHTGLHPETQVPGPGWDVWGPGRGDGSAVPSTAPLPSLAISAAWAPSSPLASFPLHCRPTLL